MERCSLNCVNGVDADPQDFIENEHWHHPDCPNAQWCPAVKDEEDQFIDTAHRLSINTKDIGKAQVDKIRSSLHRKLRPVRTVTSEEENFRIEHGISGFAHPTRNPIEPEPIGTYVVAVFKITGYDPDCDGSLMARLAHVDKDGDETGWEQTHLGLHPDTDLVVSDPSVLWEL